MDARVKEKSYRWDGKNLVLNLQAQPKANKNAIIGEYNGRIKVAVTAAPTSGKANNLLIKYLAKHFGVPQKRVEIIKGGKTRYKLVTIKNPQKNIPDIDSFKK